MQPVNRWDRLAAYVLGGLSSQEHAEAERWEASDPELGAQIARVRDIHLPPVEKAVVDVEQALSRVAGKLRIDVLSSPARQSPSKIVRRHRGSRKVYASVVGATACLAAAIMILVTRQTGPGVESTYHTALAEQASLTLPDGSRVMLAPDSRITVDKGFGDRTRTLRLIGEAFFDVRNASGAPFIVQTGEVRTRVLGTAFGIRAYPSDPSVRVAVTSGTVESGGPHQSLTLTAGTVGELADSTVASSRVNDMSSYVGWTNGQLVFENVAAGKMLATIGRWYGYTFRVPDSTLAERRFTGVFSLSERVETMQLLERLLNVNMQVTGDAVIVHPRPARRDTPPPRRMDPDVFSPSAEVGK